MGCFQKNAVQARNNDVNGISLFEMEKLKLQFEVIKRITALWRKKETPEIMHIK